ncbi:glutamate racemase [Pseudomonas sp. R3-52-08]|uniref:glutamate racemase n=1 Tax=Pseudomonas sp. R3-52-08 TaxID=1173284 RepID=UPI000F5780E0|nr:aspartate/glutamate racemase family protein [Pseudomonas sp. R3-52-08]AZF21603.1 Glutamate racemase [Pseudomonas sp. R3-52-08]
MIGVFDFGSGGLTVMRAFESALPNEEFVYLGDHGNAPYGNNSSEHIFDLTQAAVARLFKHGCTLVVIACNTAVATSLRKLRETWLPERYPNRQVIGVIVPVAEEIAGTPVSQAFDVIDDPCVESVAVFATQHTVQSNAFGVEINSRRPHIKVYQQICHGLALLIEQDACEEVLRAEIRKHVDALLSATSKKPDVCVLGCTHYPIVEHLWRAELPASTRIVSQPDTCARGLIEHLRRNPHLSTKRTGNNRFFTTGDIETVSERASLFYKSAVSFSKMDT